MDSITARWIQAGLVLSILLTAPVMAAEHTVEASGTTFSPQSLSIATGDSVTWVNTGGLHNVAANDLSFRCAIGCDGTGGNGNPSTGWEFTLVFVTLGSVDYHCEVHVALGMTGLITICEADLVLADQEVIGMEVFTAPNTITTGPAFTVFPGGDATLRASMVVLGNGTAVLDGGKLTVELATVMPCD